jgi:hypothetical protein
MSSPDIAAGAVAATLLGWRRSWSAYIGGGPGACGRGAGGASGGWRVASSYHERVMAGFDLLRRRRRFEALMEPAGLPVAELAVVHHTPVAVPRSAR